jgi:hypothetical protein
MKKILLITLLLVPQLQAMEQGNASNKPYQTLSPALSGVQTVEGIRSQGLDDVQAGLVPTNVALPMQTRRTPRQEFYALTASFPQEMRDYVRGHFEQKDSHTYDVTMEEARELAKMYYKQLGIPFPEINEISAALEEETRVRDERLDALPSIDKILQELKEAREKSDDKK